MVQDVVALPAPQCTIKVAIHKLAKLLLIPLALLTEVESVGAGSLGGLLGHWGWSKGPRDQSTARMARLDLGQGGENKRSADR